MKKILFTFAILSFTLFQPAHASTPQIKKQAPGYYRFIVGDIEVTPLFDGIFSMNTEQLLTNIKPAELKKALADSHHEAVIPTSVNGFLINTGTKLILIDAGAGSFFGPTLGQLLTNLKASGYQPEQVDEIYLTHMHSDHLGALSTDAKKNFPNATIRMDKQESDYWLSDTEAQKADPSMKGMFGNAKTAFAPYQASNQVKPFTGETELVPGIHAHPAPGHTPGHTVYSIESKGKKLWLVGDIIHVASVQFQQPTVTIKFDYNPKMATSERLKDFDHAAKDGDLIGGAHLSFPGVGYVKKVGKGYLFQRIDYN